MDFVALSTVLGNLGEFLGALLLIGSLIYVGTQIRQHTEAIAIQVHQARADGAQELHLRVADSETLSRLWNAVEDDARVPHTESAHYVFNPVPLSELTDTELQRLKQLAIALARRLENLIYQGQRGYLDAEVYEQAVATVRGVEPIWRAFDVRIGHQLREIVAAGEQRESA